VRDEHQRRVPAEDRLHPRGAFTLEVDVADGEYLAISRMSGSTSVANREAEARDHAGRVRPQRRVDEVADSRIAP
jgi:hypothetical protein